MRLWAIGDLHLGHAANRAALDGVSDHGDDWLILAGDVGERPAQLVAAFEILGRRFGRLLWVPGNHELWTPPRQPGALRGEARYRRLVELCRRHGVITPEDPYPLWEGPEGPLVVAPLFLLYDYSFRPAEVAAEEVVAWAQREDVLCTDELLLHPDPYPSRQAWCAARCALTARRLEAIDPALDTVLINHWPLRYDLVNLPRIPRFSPWCGTRASEDWHRRFRARVVVSGHLHVRGTAWRDGVRFEEVSLGYPRQWDPARGIDAYLRPILPGPMGASRAPRRGLGPMR
ncbi:MAG: metallophosphoesterase [Acidobacteria bacterium]|nr:MAG: metallophosphoesterase [Acidobacteriota bacterium]